MNTDKEFVPYQQSLDMKELGFDEPCLIKDTEQGEECAIYYAHDNGKPTYSQAFRWLYQKLDIEKGVMPLDTESQQLLLKELIDKVSSKHLLV